MSNQERINHSYPEGQASFTRKALDAVLNSHEYSPSKLVNFFEKKYHADFAADAGVWEGYTLKQHTTMVLSQFDKYFSKQPLPAETDINFFRVILTLHDIGKPEAIRNGSKHFQHKYTKPKLFATLDELGYTDKEKNIALAIVDGDFIGETIKTGKTIENAKKIIRAAQSTNMPTEEFFNLLTVYYKSDAGSYTRDAGGYESLDYLFIFNQEKITLHFAPPIDEKIQKLKATVVNLRPPQKNKFCSSEEM